MTTESAPVAASLDLDLAPWRAVNDGVMGGISAGGMRKTDLGLQFAGRLSLANNGGFSSVRRAIPGDLSAITGVRLTVRGDGRRYQFRLRQTGRLSALAWRAEFDTSGETQSVELEFADFVPVFRGRIIADAGPVDTKLVREIGFLIADKREGSFALEIHGIEWLGRSD